MIPGPVEFEPAVLEAMGAPTNSHLAQEFMECFGNALEMMRAVWRCPSGQPFILAGSGTLAMDSAAANLVEPGDRVLVISTGYFGDRYAEILERYGAEVTCLRSETGGIVARDTIEEQLKKNNYKLLTFTHVDTSTAVMVDPRSIGMLGSKYNVLTILDGVCSVGGEDIRQEEWGLDVVLTASQKAIGVPPGLALLVVSERALAAWKTRKKPVSNYYGDWSNWLPVMTAYESRRPAYFGTPAVNLVEALHVSLRDILNEGMDVRIERHRSVGKAVRAAMKAMGLQQVPRSDDVAANTLTAVYYPEGVSGGELLKEINRSGIILAGGLLPEIKDYYFRIGHMGSVSQNDLVATISGIATGLQRCGYSVDVSSALQTALDIYNTRIK